MDGESTEPPPPPLQNIKPPSHRAPPFQLPLTLAGGAHYDTIFEVLESASSKLLTSKFSYFLGNGNEIVSFKY